MLQVIFDEEEEDELFQWWWEATVPEIEKQVAEFEARQAEAMRCDMLSQILTDYEMIMNAISIVKSKFTDVCCIFGIRTGRFCCRGTAI